MAIELVRATEEPAHIVENLIPFYIWESAVCSFTNGEFRTTRGTEEPWGFELVFQHFTSKGTTDQAGPCRTL